MRLSHLSIALAAAVTLAPAAVAAKDVKVGVITPYSGGSAQLGEQMDPGMMLYYNEHKGELGGNTITLIKRDSKGPNADTAKVLAQELITREHVQILAGLIYSPNAMAIAPLITEAKVPTIIMNAGTAFITNMSPYYRPRLVLDVARRLYHGQIRGREAALQDRGGRLHRLPAGQGQPRGVQGRLQSAGGK